MKKHNTKVEEVTQVISDFTEETLKEVMTAMITTSDAKLFACTEAELPKLFYFNYDSKASQEWNLYQFSSALEPYKQKCRRWEEHYHGSCCVVKRVRDKYVIPQVKIFLKNLTCDVKD